MVSSNDMLVNNETTLYETYSSSSGNGGKRFIISAKETVSLMEYLLLQKGLKLKKKEKEKNMIKNKFKKADFPTKFIDSVIKDFEYNERNKDQQDDFIIPPYLSEEPKPRIGVEISFCELNEKRVSTFRKKFKLFTNDSYDLNVNGKLRKLDHSFL